jgi:hypothetical protein
MGMDALITDWMCEVPQLSQTPTDGQVPVRVAATFRFRPSTTTERKKAPAVARARARVTRWWGLVDRGA